MEATTIDKQPLVSVVIPTRNRLDALPRALESLKSQTYKFLEVIIVDDASTDDPAGIIASYDQYLKIIYIRNETKQGAARTRNLGLKRAGGKYISLLDDDDEFFATKIEKQVAAAELIGKPAFIVCNGYGQDDSPAYDPSKPTGYIQWGKGRFPICCGLPTPSSWFFHRNILHSAGFFDEHMARWEDVEYCLRLMMAGPVYVVNEFLVKWHRSLNSVTGMSAIEIEARKYFLKKHFGLMKRDRHYLYQFYWRLGKDLKQVGNLPEAADFFWRALCVRPHRLESLGLFGICVWRNIRRAG